MVHFLGHEKKILEGFHKVEDRVLPNSNISLFKIITIWLTHTPLLTVDTLRIKPYASHKSDLLLGTQISLISLMGT